MHFCEAPDLLGNNDSRTKLRGISLHLPTVGLSSSTSMTCLLLITGILGLWRLLRDKGYQPTVHHHLPQTSNTEPTSASTCRLDILGTVKSRTRIPSILPKPPITSWSRSSSKSVQRGSLAVPGWLSFPRETVNPHPTGAEADG